MDKTPQPIALIPWLRCTTSLTQKLREHAGDAEMQVLRHEWDQTDWWDRHVLKLADGLVLHREIIMRAHQIPCWYARTIIPQQTFLADEKCFARLKDEPLGALIFGGGAGIKRQSLEHDCLNPSSFEWHDLPADVSTDLAAQKTASLWRRLSTFSLTASGDLFYLLEIFLPGLEQFA